MLAAGGARAAPFRVYQYLVPGAAAPKKCHPKASASMPLAEYGLGRWAQPKSLQLLFEDCAVEATELMSAKAPALALAAIRVADEPPQQLLLTELMPRMSPSVAGWPTLASRRKQEKQRLPDAALLRVAALCWPSANGWPVPDDRAGADARQDLEPTNVCEWWLLPFKKGAGAELQPDLAGRSFLIVPNSRFDEGGHFFARREWPQIFSDPNASIQAALLEGWDTAPTSEVALAPTKTAPGAAPQRMVTASRDAPLPQCASDVEQTHRALFDRFASWAERFDIAKGEGPAFAPARWEGRCGAYEVLRSALEEALACKLEAGACQTRDDFRAGGSR